MNLSAQNKKGHASRQAGFTLIEILLVIGILAILIAITLIAINPARQFSQANNTQRSSDVTAILNAINQYMIDNDGAVPAGSGVAISATPTNMGSNNAIDVNICNDIIPLYIAELPVDPRTGSITTGPCSVYNTAYDVYRSATNNRITVTADDTELGIPDIFVTR